MRSSGQVTKYHYITLGIGYRTRATQAVWVILLTECIVFTKLVIWAYSSIKFGRRSGQGQVK